mmetsp:Transcript_41062/g.80555  ORF Transcript_41062/g.80555 Transcript_41062/m.80555 type:complete len:303 (-) Transcript_41062:76-984(-)|eukprot:CAMPEP_0175153216 /NCGR_PEP_ID=MMETSP0087-20121206/19599_1 /TAXON_ID=136419 /ORGANISM="Unknown Unknown, Strain D1" /LENGTH=302 /DNA_ID=CAMNT_0016439841 /DNA_START=335 /DNA_END=1243 /DNA_ORIENTATION=+
MVIPKIGLGTYLMGDKTADSVLTGLKVGYRCFDCGKPPYNEAGAGQGLKQGMEELKIAREDLFISTKVWPGNPAWGMPAKTAAGVQESVEDSLKQLQVDYLDLCLIHVPFCKDARLEQWRALVELKQQKKIKAIGVSNYTVAHLEEIKEAGLPMPEANQIELHPWCQRQELVAFHKQNGITTIAYSSLVPLAEWRASEDPKQRFSLTEQIMADSSSDQAAFQSMAHKYSATKAQVLLKWALQKGYAIIPKSTSEERMKENLNLFGFEISQEDMQLLDTMDKQLAAAWGGNLQGSDPMAVCPT